MGNLNDLILDFLNKSNADVYEKDIMINRICKYFSISEKSAIDGYDNWRKFYMKTKGLDINPGSDGYKALYFEKVKQYREERKSIQEIANVLSIYKSTVVKIVKILNE
ncbi:MAG: hypothetical protein NSGCLCUN01_03654 [uncultured Clostridium sp.]